MDYCFLGHIKVTKVKKFNGYTFIPKEPLYGDISNEVFSINSEWGGNYFLEHLPNTRCFLIWDKMTYVPTMSQVELAWTSFKKHSLLKKINSNQLDRFHPTQKPVALYDWIYSVFTEEGGRF